MNKSEGGRPRPLVWLQISRGPLSASDLAPDAALGFERKGAKPQRLNTGPASAEPSRFSAPLCLGDFALRISFAWLHAHWLSQSATSRQVRRRRAWPCAGTQRRPPTLTVNVPTRFSTRFHFSQTTKLEPHPVHAHVLADLRLNPLGRLSGLRFKKVFCPRRI